MSTLSAFPFIGEQSFATPGAINSPLSIISANIAAVNAAARAVSGVTITPPSGNTITVASDLSVRGTIAAGPARLGVSSNVTNYLFLSDTSASRSNYIIGSQVGGTADGLNIWDDSGQTMLVSFSKQSIRFYQNIVGPVFDVGGALAGTLNAATFGTASQSTESRIQAAISAATLAIPVVPRVYVPATMYPYSAGSVSFDTRVQMVREGGNWAVYDVKAYGAAGNGTTDDTAALQSAISAVKGIGGIVYLPIGNYKVTSQLNLVADMTFEGAGASVYGTASQILWSNSGVATFSYTSTTFATANLILRDFSIQGIGAGAPVGHGIYVNNATDVLIDRVIIQNNSGTTTAGILLDNCEDSTVRNCALLSIATGLACVNNANNNSIIGCIFVPKANGICINLDSTTDQTLIEGCDLEGASLANTIGIRLAGARVTTITGCYIEFFTVACIQPLVNTVNTTIIGNALYATSAAAACIPAASAGYITCINNEFQNIGLVGATAVGVNFGGSPAFFQGNRISGGGTGTLIQLSGTTQAGTDFAQFQGTISISTGQVYVPASTALQPGFAISSETSLGLYRSAASTLALSYGTFTIPLLNATAGALVGGSDLTISGAWGLVPGTGNRANPGGNTALFYNQASVGPTISGFGFEVRTGSGAPAAQLDINSAGSAIFAGHVQCLAPFHFQAGTASLPGAVVSSESSLGVYRSAASTLALSYGTLDITASGAVLSIASLRIKSGANNSCGTAVLGSNGSVNVANTYVAANDLIFLTDQTAGGTLGDIELGGIRAGSGFTIQSTSVTDTSTVAWLIVRPT